MRWRAHLLVGAVLVFCVSYLAGGRDPLSLALLSAFGALCALAPDLDHESSKGRKLLDAAVIAFAFLSAYIWSCGGAACLPSIAKLLPALIIFLAVLGCYLIIFRLFKPKHRGITHTIAANIVFAAALYVVFGEAIAAAGAVGYFSHLLADQHIRLV
ncbi:MAG: metal-dependent hydrolase [Candidatus Micrarchaeia archaeon]